MSSFNQRKLFQKSIMKSEKPFSAAVNYETLALTLLERTRQGGKNPVTGKENAPPTILSDFVLEAIMIAISQAPEMLKADNEQEEKENIKIFNQLGQTAAKFAVAAMAGAIAYKVQQNKPKHG